MKTAGTVCTRLGSGGALYGCSGRDDRVVKHRLENGEEEMQACFARLMQLVPTIPPNGRMTKVQLLQHVIDYILDLEMTLDFRPSESSLLRTASAVAKETDDVDRGLTSGSGGSFSATDRRPLSENALQVNNISPDAAIQQVKALHKCLITLHLLLILLLLLLLL